MCVCVCPDSVQSLSGVDIVYSHVSIESARGDERECGMGVAGSHTASNALVDREIGVDLLIQLRFALLVIFQTLELHEVTQRAPIDLLESALAVAHVNVVSIGGHGHGCDRKVADGDVVQRLPLLEPRVVYANLVPGRAGDESASLRARDERDVRDPHGLAQADLVVAHVLLLEQLLARRQVEQAQQPLLASAREQRLSDGLHAEGANVRAHNEGRRASSVLVEKRKSRLWSTNRLSSFGGFSTCFARCRGGSGGGCCGFGCLASRCCFARCCCCGCSWRHVCIFFLLILVHLVAAVECERAEGSNVHDSRVGACEQSTLAHARRARHSSSAALQYRESDQLGCGVDRGRSARGGVERLHHTGALERAVDLQRVELGQQLFGVHVVQLHFSSLVSHDHFFLQRLPPSGSGAIFLVIVAIGAGCRHAGAGPRQAVHAAPLSVDLGLAAQMNRGHAGAQIHAYTQRTVTHAHTAGAS